MYPLAGGQTGAVPGRCRPDSGSADQILLKCLGERIVIAGDAYNSLRPAIASYCQVKASGIGQGVGPCPGVLVVLHTQSATAFSCPRIAGEEIGLCFRINAGLHQLAVRVHGVVEDRPVEQLSKLRDAMASTSCSPDACWSSWVASKRTSVL
mgnify:CR=1 FL=1